MGSPTVFGQAQFILDSPLYVLDEVPIEVDFSAGCKLCLGVIAFFLYNHSKINEISHFLAGFIGNRHDLV